MDHVLLLNASYEPLRIISWRRAVTLFFTGKVEVLEEYEHDIRSVSIVIRAPAVVRLLSFVKMGRRCPPLSRPNVLARDRFTCQYCRRGLSSREATLDHVIPKSQGGTTEWENVVTCCPTCNRKKGGRTPKQAGMPLERHPIRPDWLPVLNIRLNGNVPLSWQTFLLAYMQS